MIDSSMLKTGSGTKLFASAAMAIIVSIAIYNWAISPQAEYVKAARQYEKVAKNTELKTMALEELIERKQQELEQLRIALAKIEDPFFDGSSALEFLSNIEPLTAKAGCVDVSINYLTPEIIKFKEDGYSGLTVLIRRAKISLNGQYGNITEFIKQIDDNEKKVFLSDLDLAVSRDFTTMTCSMDITIYSLEGEKIPQVK